MKYNSIPIILLDKPINNPKSVSKLKSFQPDLLVSILGNQIFKAPILNLAPKGCINLHTALLPKYRGLMPSFWVMKNNEIKTGVSVFFVDEGIDTGDIISQKVYPINDDDNYSTLLNRAFVGCADLLFETLQSFKDNSFTRTNQSKLHPVGFYCGGRGMGDEIIDWNNTSRDIFNFIRSISKPGPVARTFNGNKEVKINNSNYMKDAPIYIGTVGQVLSKTENGFLIKTKDSFIEVFDIEGKLRVGDKL